MTVRIAPRCSGRRSALRLPTEASNTDEALNNIVALLDFDEADVMVELARFDLLALGSGDGAAARHTRRTRGLTS